MKTFKLNEHSVFPRPFAFRGTMHLAIGVLVYFDLTDGHTLYTEQELWQTVPDLLGPLPVLDQGMPKPRGEVLAVGSCFAPKGETRPASRVRIRVGDMDKSLNVYGERYWKGGLITDPEPFAEMPLDWAHAFGGAEYEKNKAGKGLAPAILPDGTQRIPLPNIELPGQQIGSQHDRPDPACFDQLPLDHPDRMAKTGTYDDKWKRERWPYFPDDMDYEFFNAAARDQYIGDYFKGGESIVVENMHPDMPRIQGTLPNLRMRVFATHNPEYSLYQFPTGPLPSQQLRDTDVFSEIKTRLETVWLFPTVLRGVAIYRGTTEVRDEEFMDVPRLLVRHEDPAEPPKSLEHYRNLQLELLSRGVDMDMGPIDAAMDKVKESMLKAKNIPKTLDAMRQEALGNVPRMPPPIPAEMVATNEKQLAAHHASLDTLDAMVKDMHAKHGHLVEIDLTACDTMRSKLADVGSRVKAAAAKIEAAQQKVAARQAAMAGKAEAVVAKMSPQQLRTAGIDPGALPFAMPIFQVPPVNPWHDAGFPLVVAAKKRMDDDAARKAIKPLGLSEATVKKAWLGWLPEPVACKPEDFGLEPGEGFVIPGGLVLPRFDGPVLNRILVMPDPAKADETFLVPGSDETALFLPSATLIDLPAMPAASGAPVVRVADELQALLLEELVGDSVSVVAMATPNAVLGDDAAKGMEAADPLLVSLPEGWEKQPDLARAWEAWQAACPAAEPLALESGSTVFEARAKGSELRDWIFSRLPKEYAEEHSIAIEMPQIGKPPNKDFLKGFEPPLPADMDGVIKGLMEEIKAGVEAKVAPVRAQKEAALAQVRQRLKDMGMAVTGETADATPRDPGVVIKQVMARLEKKRAELEAADRLTPELDQRFADGLAQCQQLDATSQGLMGKFKAQLDGMPKDGESPDTFSAMEPPEEIKQALAGQGIDPDKIKPVTRQEVERMHAAGESLAGCILSGLDLSEMDLAGADLTGCRMENADCSGSVLDGATLVQVIGKNVDFSRASLKEANLQKAIFPDTVFDKADLTGAKLTMAVLLGARFNDAVLVDADFDMAIFNEMQGRGADFRNASMSMSMLGGDLSQADFRGATVRKCLFKDAVADHVDFSGAALPETLFSGTTGKGVRFAGADMSNFRTGNNTAMPGADFSGAQLSDSALREADLSGANFRGATLDRAIVEETQLVGADLNRSVAKGARFSKTNLEGASMRGMDLLTGSLRKSRLVDADIRGSNLYAVDFYKAVLGNTRLEGSNLKKTHLHNRLDLLDEEA